MEKSHVSMEKKICIVCAKEYETNAILLDKRLRASLERYTVTGMGMCDADRKKSEDGYIALIAIDPEKSEPSGNRVHSDKAYRTGEICHIRDRAFNDIFDVEIPAGRFLFIDQAVVDQLARIPVKK